MFRLYVLISFVFCLPNLQAQNDKKISFKVTGVIDVNDFKPNDEESKTDSALANFEQRKLVLQMLLDSTFGKRAIDTMEVWREKNLVISQSYMDKGLTKFYDVKSQKFFVFNKLSFQGKGDTISQWLTCDKQPNCAGLYKVTLKKGLKKILGYSCQNYVIEEDLKSVSEYSNRVFSVWVTDKIKPAIPTYAFLRLCKKILGQFTCLEAKEQFEKNGLSHQLMTAINIRSNREK